MSWARMVLQVELSRHLAPRRTPRHCRSNRSLPSTTSLTPHNRLETRIPLTYTSLLPPPHTGVRDAISRLTERDTDCWECGWAVGSPLPHADLSTFAQFSIANVAVCGIAVLKMRKTKGQLVDGFIGAGVKRVSTEFASEPKVGRPLLLYSSPFGLVTPLVLSNMVSRGIVSNIVAVVREPHGIDKTSVALMVTDVRVLPGMEGASCFYYDGANGGEFAGMAMVPIRRKDGDPVDLALIIPARTILSAVEPFLSFSSSLSPSPSAVRIAATDRDAALARTRSAVVLIAVNNTWASGVIVSEDGYILTSAHIFYEFLEEESPGSPRARLKDWVRVRVRIGDCVSISDVDWLYWVGEYQSFVKTGVSLL
ncbi:hypothetical protein BC936DRAFT_138167 [Jimgerdemannia flammicorona]|uniref:Trypsin-like cysteine/serine peptidase domain-containing protein n=1 Tax=Jimgerdemannia flammicorona TaxID=994334 RepID=A0A433CVK0_9FUNG|nr:hypothetical protein BC936DRAFT_138167 [Jimgerdemannia flammicorona]